MKEIVFIWNFPYVAGFPIGQLLFKKRARVYCELLNKYFMSHDLKWHISLDTTHGDLTNLLESNYEMFIFLPGGQTRFWSYSEELKNSRVLLYYLSEMEFYKKDISKLVESINFGEYNERKEELI